MLQISIKTWNVLDKTRDMLYVCHVDNYNILIA